MKELTYRYDSFFQGILVLLLTPLIKDFNWDK